MTHTAKDKQHYIAAWKDHVRQLMPLFGAADQCDDWPEFARKMNDMVVKAADREFADPQRLVPTE